MRAARVLGCSVFDLVARPNRDWWVGCALTYEQVTADLRDAELAKAQKQAR